MAIRKCNCGNYKNVQPFNSSMVYPWICDYCAGRIQRPADHHTQTRRTITVKSKKILVLKRS